MNTFVEIIDGFFYRIIFYSKLTDEKFGYKSYQ